MNGLIASQCISIFNLHVNACCFNNQISKFLLSQSPWTHVPSGPILCPAVINE